MQINGYVSLCQNGPSNYTSDWSSKRPVATGLGPVFQISPNPGNHNWTNHQRAWTATTVWSFCGPTTGLLNINWTVVDIWVKYLQLGYPGTDKGLVCIYPLNGCRPSTCDVHSLDKGHSMVQCLAQLHINVFRLVYHLITP